MPEKFKAILFPGTIVAPSESTGRTLKDVLDKWIDSEGNLVLSPDTKIPPTRIEPSTKLIFRKITNPDGTTENQFLGSTTSLITYTQMADFSYSPQNPESHIHTAAVSRQSVPLQYNFEGNPNVSALEAKLAEQEENEDSGSVAFLRFRDTGPVPSCPTQLVLATQDSASVDQDLVAKVRTLFEARPVWQRANLEEALGQGPLPAWRLAGALRLVAYLFLDGPWRKSYVRFGYDPRTDPESKKLQMIDFRDPFFKSGEGQRGSVAQGPVDVRFRRAPTNRSQLYQLCDIEDPGIQAVLSGGVRAASQPDAHTGWLTASEMESIRNQMKIKSESLRRLGK